MPTAAATQARLRSRSIARLRAVYLPLMQLVTSAGMLVVIVYGGRLVLLEKGATLDGIGRVVRDGIIGRFFFMHLLVGSLDPTGQRVGAANIWERLGVSLKLLQPP